MEGIQKGIDLCSLTKSYKGFLAVDHISLNIGEGEIFGFLGPNGSGKTTTFLMILGFTEITEGTVSVFGVDPVRDNMEIKKTVAYLPDTLGFYSHMRVIDNLLYTGRLLDLSREEAEKLAWENLELVGLQEAAEKYASQLSRGMRQRLGIADLLMKRPKVLILDEPTLGLDPKGANEFLELITQLARERKITVLISSHQLEHIRKICDRIAIFKKGHVLDVGTPSQLIETLAAKQAFLGEIHIDAPEEAELEKIKRMTGVEEIRQERFATVLMVRREQVQSVALQLMQAGHMIRCMDDKSISLEEVYQYYFG